METKIIVSWLLEKFLHNLCLSPAEGQAVFLGFICLFSSASLEEGKRSFFNFYLAALKMKFNRGRQHSDKNARTLKLRTSACSTSDPCTLPSPHPLPSSPVAAPSPRHNQPPSSTLQGTGNEFSTFYSAVLPTKDEWWRQICKQHMETRDDKIHINKS